LSQAAANSSLGWEALPSWQHWEEEAHLPRLQLERKRSMIKLRSPINASGWGIPRNVPNVIERSGALLEFAVPSGFKHPS
jgi:hypothetical protein